MTEPCVHLAEAHQRPEPDGPTARECVDCVAEGTRWVHLRLCLDLTTRSAAATPRRCKHASAHAAADRATRSIRSFEPGEDWRWCYADQVMA